MKGATIEGFIIWCICIPYCDKWMIVDHMDLVPEIIGLMTKFGLLYSDSAMALDNINTSAIPPNASFSDRVLYGVQKALRKLAEETAMKDDSLVVKIDGEIKEVPAKELLKTLPK